MDATERTAAADAADSNTPAAADNTQAANVADGNIPSDTAPTANPPADRKPVVVVDDLHVKYRVYAAGKRARPAGGRALLDRQRRGLRTIHALRGVSFVAYENESIGVIGSNGSGKSTLMRAITGLTPPASGAVYAKSRPNMLGVGAALIPDLSGERNIILGGLALGMSRKEIEALEDEIVEFSGLQDFIEFPMRTYSSGMQARLKFAIAAVRSHEILIVDEALSVGDRGFRKRSEARIREIRDGAGTVFLVSHSMSSIKDTCDRVIWIDKGKVMLDGDPDEVVAAYTESKK
jgi:teichoic acid transport system ATP-binding protein